MVTRFERFMFRLDRFGSAADRVRTRALGWISLALTGVSVLLLPILGNPTLAALVAVLAAANLTALALLRFGKPDAAALFAVLSFSALTNAIVFSQTFEDNEIYMLATFNLFTLIVSSLVSRNGLPPLLAAATGGVAVGLHLFLRRAPNFAEFGYGKPSDYVVAAASVLIGGLIVRGVAARNREHLEESRRAADAERRRSLVYSEVLADARSGLDAGKGLTESAERTAGLVAEIVQRAELAESRLEALLAEGRKLDEARRAMAEAAARAGASVDEQVEVVEEAGAAVVQMTGSIDSISRIAREREQAAESLERDAARGAEAMQRVEKGMDELRLRVAGTGEIVKVIKKVASQTGLLAMNASIEAAHAGDSGGGFAVVAEEIRALADETARNAKLVAETLASVGKAITEVAELNAEASVAYAVVRGEAGKVTAAVVEIARGAVELAGGTEEINRGATRSVGSSQTAREAVAVVGGRVGEVEAGLASQAAASGAIEESIRSMSELLAGLAAEADRVREAGEANRLTLEALGRGLSRLESPSGASVPSLVPAAGDTD
ncbi:MAG: hypothetical protein JXA15_11800 [Spirochaetales bacterium]|nr:hypothetical protein [Spirochaetales bacterium]